MAAEVWQKVASSRRNGGFMATLVQILTLGIAGNPEHWEVEFENRQNGRKVIGSGPTEEEAEREARSHLA